MHHKTKAALVAKYADLINHGTTKEEVIEFLATEEKVESQEDKDELLEALFPSEKGSERPAKKPVKTHYVEWDVKIVGGKAEKLKVSRPVVKISEEEADTLNAGILTGGNTYAKMYFLPE